MSVVETRPVPGSRDQKPPPRTFDTEAQLLELLRKRFAKNGNGGSGEYALLTHVRNGAGFDASRTLDAVSVNLWPSRGLEIHGFEVKVSRSDWLRELKDPAKAEAACKLVDRFWVVAPKGLVNNLPSTWGLLEVVGEKLVQAVAAPLLHEGDCRRRPVSRDFLVGMLRSVPLAIPKKGDDDREVQEAYSRGRREAAEEWQQTAERATQDLDQLRQRLVEFGQILGVEVDRMRYHAASDAGKQQFAKIAEALRVVMRGDDMVEQARNRVRSIVQSLRDEANRIEQGRRW